MDGEIFIIQSKVEEVEVKKVDLICVECGRVISKIYVPKDRIVMICCCGCLSEAKKCK